jgi:hypothetical protein
MSTTARLTRFGARRLAQEHAAVVQATIELYQLKAAAALKFAQVASKRGDAALAAGFLDEAETFRAMALGLAELQTNTSGGSR